MLGNVIQIKIMNERVESKWEYEKLAKREHLFQLSSKPFNSDIIKDKLKKSAWHLLPTEIKTLTLTEEGCKYYACPSIIKMIDRGPVDVSTLDLASLVKENVPEVSEYCFQKYRRRLIERDNPNIKSPFDNFGNLQWRKLSDGRMGCAVDTEVFRNWLLFPSLRDEKYKRGVTDAPPFVLHDDNQFDMTEKYCRFKGVSYKKADEGKHNDDCYLTRGQIVTEALLGYWHRDLYSA